MRKKTLISLCTMLLMGAAWNGASPAPAVKASSWKVVLPQFSAVNPGLSLNLLGPAERFQPGYSGFVYDDTESAIEVYPTIGMMSGGSYWTIFRTWVHFPEKIEILGVGPFVQAVDASVPLVSPSFPNGSTSLTGFLNGTHPYDSHYLVDIVFMGPYVSTRAEADWENKPVGWRLNGRVTISIEPEEFLSGDCNLCRADHHDILIQSHEAYLLKESAQSYRVVMTATFADATRNLGEAPWMPNISKDFILHRFCDCAERTSKKTTYFVKEYHYPELGFAPMNLEMLYIKN